MAVLSSILLDPDNISVMGPIQIAGISIAAISFALAFVPSIVGAGELVMAPLSKPIARADVERIEWNLLIGSCGFFIGVSVVVGLVLQVMITNVAKLLFS